MNALINISDKNFLFVPGGMLVRDNQLTIISTVGITGDLSDEEEHCAITGILASGLKTDAGNY